ncbi:MAG: type VI secretion system tip protein TssI/VgrG [Myxococcota bacterium]
MRPVVYSIELVSRGGAGFESVGYDADAWHVRSLELREAIDEPFWLELTLIAEDPHLPVESLVGRDVVFTAERGEFERRLTGVVTSAVYLGTFDAKAHLQLVVRPTLALAALSECSRIFQGLTVPEIVQQVAGEHLRGGAVDISHLKDKHEARDYCVQFRETDLAFVRRILAEEGIAFVGHQTPEDKHRRLLLIDAPDRFTAAPLDHEDPDEPAAASLPILTAGSAGYDGRPAVSMLEWRRSMTTQEHQARAFDWLATPGTTLDSAATPGTGAPWTHGKHFEHSVRRTPEDGPAHRDETDRLASLLRDRAQTRSGGAHGRSNALGFAAGFTVTLEGHPNEDLDQTYLLTRVTHRADNPEVDIRRGDAEGEAYSNRFEAIPAHAPYRPRPLPKPRAYGQQTATVIGPPGEEIHTDALGRIRVWMHWDRPGSDVALDHACWLRVAQPLAGPGFGTMFLPRVGMEVLVSFVDGDPDRPICVGCLYDGANTPPYALPDDRTKTTIKTQSSPGGGGFNELRFEDAAGSEQVYLHAQRNLDETVKAAHTMGVGSTQRITVGADQSLDVSGSRDITVQGNQNVVVKGTPRDGPPQGHKMTVNGSITTTATKSSSLTAPESISLVCAETSLVLTPAGIVLKAGGGASVVITAAMIAQAAGGAVQLGMGADGKASLSSATGGGMEVDGEVRLSSMAGAKVHVAGTVTTKAAGGAKLELSQDAKMSGGTVRLNGDKGQLQLDRNADLFGGEVFVHSNGGTVGADAKGVKVQGAKVETVGGALASITAPVVKVN